MRAVQIFATAAALLGVLGTATAGPRGGYAACKDKAAMARSIELSDESDYQAAAQLIRRGIKSKDCQIIPADELIIEATPPLSRLVKAHRRGDPDVYWIVN